MRNNDSATASSGIALGGLGGLGLAALGVLVFSFTLPSTVYALDGLDPYVIGFGRAAVAALAAAIALAAVRARRPRGRQWGALAVVAGGVVFGFPVLTTLALDQGASASHSAVIVGLLPATTAVLAVVRAGERPSPAFWLASAAGAVCVTGFAVIRGSGRFTAADLLLFAGLAACAIGYAEGGRLARTMPGWRVISWALVLAAPITVPATVWLLATTDQHWTGHAVFGFAYVSLGSMYLGFFAWYAGMARVGIARASQVQLAQPILTLLWSWALLDETVDAATLLTALGVVVCVALTQRTRITGGVAAQPLRVVALAPNDGTKTATRT